jgi:hypothetical protein
MHQEILICIERYKRVPKKITPEYFTFERILDYREGETNIPREKQVELLEGKDPKRLKWIGDKRGAYFKHYRKLSENNPGARFILLYRAVEEVAESWEERARNLKGRWSSEMDFKSEIETWNDSLRRTREFVESGFNPNVLIVDYHDFFYRNERCVPVISRFLEIEFDSSTLEAWERRSSRFEDRRRCKDLLDDEQLKFVRDNKDHAAEEWTLERIRQQSVG